MDFVTLTNDDLLGNDPLYMICDFDHVSPIYPSHLQLTLGYYWQSDVQRGEISKWISQNFNLS